MKNVRLAVLGLATLAFALATLTFPGAARIKATGFEACIVEPNPVRDGQVYTIVGSGFSPGIRLKVTIGESPLGLVVADYLGRWVYSDFAGFVEPAALTVSVYAEYIQGTKEGGRDRHQKPLATCTLNALGNP